MVQARCVPLLGNRLCWWSQWLRAVCEVRKDGEVERGVALTPSSHRKVDRRHGIRIEPGHLLPLLVLAEPRARRSAGDQATRLHMRAIRCRVQETCRRWRPARGALLPGQGLPRRRGGGRSSRCGLGEHLLVAPVRQQIEKTFAAAGREQECASSVAATAVELPYRPERPEEMLFVCSVQRSPGGPEMDGSAAHGEQPRQLIPRETRAASQLEKCLLRAPVRLKHCTATRAPNRLRVLQQGICGRSAAGPEARDEHPGDDCRSRGRPNRRTGGRARCYIVHGCPPNRRRKSSVTAQRKKV